MSTQPHSSKGIQNNTQLDDKTTSPLPIRLMSAGAFTLLAVIALVLPVPSSISLKLASIFILLAGCLVFFAGQSKLFAPSVFLVLAFSTRCLPVYSLFLILAVPLAIYGLLVWKVPTLSSGRSGFVMGRIEKRPLIVTIAVTAVCVSGLIAWYIISDPDFSGFTDSFGDRATVAVILGGLLFSVVNVLVSETVFRGVVWQGIQECFPKVLPVVLIQGLLYGAAHFWGALPSGWEGAILSGVYGLLLGVIRHSSNGLTLPIISHLCVDLTLLSFVLHSLDRI